MKKLSTQNLKYNIFFKKIYNEFMYMFFLTIISFSVSGDILLTRANFLVSESGHKFEICSKGRRVQRIRCIYKNSFKLVKFTGKVHYE